MKRMILKLASACAIFVVLAGDVRAEAPRYAALLANGQRLEGHRLQNWHQRAQMPRLDGKELMNAGNPLSWLRDRWLQPGQTPDAYIEMISGDRLPGLTLQFERADGPTQWESLPPHFVVQPTIEVSPPNRRPHETVRVIRRFVRRIVWQPRRGDGDYQPGTLFFKDGTSLTFRAARFGASSVRLLREADQKRVPFREIAELHLPAEEPWASYYEELATLSPTGEQRLMEIDTTDGLIVTASDMRFIATSHGNANDSNNWYHGLQPAWCLDTLWACNSTVWMRRSWPVEHVPLTHILPVDSRSRSILAQGERDWQRNRNTRCRALESAQQSHGWGYGVHAYSELHFPLPDIVASFRTRVGLDSIVGAGGCVLAKVYGGSTDSNPLYKSPHIVGSQKLHDTNNINLATLPPERRTLILQVEQAHDGRPAKADPFDIRDIADWLDPTVTLQRDKLLTEVAARVPNQFAAFDNWEIIQHPDGEYRYSSDLRQYDREQPGEFCHQIGVRNQPLVLSRKFKVGPNDHWLLVCAYRQRGNPPQPELLVRIDGIEVAASPIPLRSGERMPDPLVVSLTPYVGHTIDLEVVQQPAVDPGLPPVVWHGLKIGEQLPTLYRALEDNAELATVQKPAEATNEARFVDADQHSGTRSLSIGQGGAYEIRFGQPVEIRSNPQFGQRRFLRYASRKKGQGSLQIELLYREARGKRAVYSSGVLTEKEDSDDESAINVWKLELPDEWIVTTRDVYSDFGEIDVTGVVLHVPDGERALFDHIYFASKADDFNLLPAAPSPELTNQQARKELAKAVLDKGHPATVAILIDGRQATGVLVNDAKHVLTAGHVLGIANKECEIQLVTGQRLPAKTRGIYRAADLGVIEISDHQGVKLRGLSLHEAKELSGNQLYVGFALEPFTAETPGATAHIVGVQRDFRETMWSDFHLENTTTGGPLLDREGRIVGTQIRDSRFGGFLYAKSFVAKENWERMKRGEVWGQWFPGSGPMLGVDITSMPDGARVSRVYADTPAAVADVQTGDYVRRIDDQPTRSLDDVYRVLATKDPGATVTLRLSRRNAEFEKSIKLMPRVP